MSTGFHTVHVRVNDAATGQPTPCRIRFTGADGTYYAPFGRLAEFATGRGEAVGGNVQLGAKHFAYINGSCEVLLPAGTINVEIHKGPEYQPIFQELPVGLGKMALRFTLRRWSELRQEGWYSGDGRVHFLTPHAALLEASAEDVAVVNLLAQESSMTDAYGRKCSVVTNILEFSGQAPALEMPGHIVVVNTHNSHPLLGSLGLLNCHRPVYPLSFGGTKGQDDWSLADWCGQCHRKGGLVIWTKVGQGPPEYGHGEALADLIRGDIDGFEIDFFEDSPFDLLSEWYDLMNCGLRVLPAGSSGKDSNGTTLGAMRTYARLLEGEEFSYKNWIEAVRAGRTFITNGPLLSFTVSGHGPGAILDMADGTVPVQVHAEARSLVPFDQFEIIMNGAIVGSQSGGGTPCAATLETELTVRDSSWIAVRCRGQQLLPHRPASQRVFAHSAPILVQVQGRPLHLDRGKILGLISQLERMQSWAEQEARCDSDRQRQHLVEIFRDAREKLSQRMKGPCLP